ncbi:hypothetical protein ACFYRN_25020 [Streptomyces sp. NPDC005227]|uniref:hypothetical protein n=1 Tax=Streptomyces sp. NPDC005227 TaxID=3364707 RepID=UPI003688C669
MAIGYAHTVFCDRKGCRSKQTVENTRDAAHARRLARQRYGWGSDRRGDFCPFDRAAPATSSPANAAGATKGRRP